MVKKAPKKDNNKFSVVYNLFYIFPLPLWKKTKPLTFSVFFVTGNRKTARKKRPVQNFFFFFFFLLFLHPTAPRNRKNYQSPFFSKFRLKVPKTAAKRAQFSFFTKYLVSAVITQTHTPTHTHSLFRPIMSKKTRLRPFS